MDPATPQPPASPDAAACARARATLPSYLSGDLALEALVDLRAHLARCEACRADLQGGLGMAGAMNHRPRAERDESARTTRRLEQRRRALSGAFLLSARNPIGARLRLLLLPAFFAFLMLQVTRGPMMRGGPALTALKGEVYVDSQRVTLARAARPVGRGERCSTGAASGARLALGATSVRLEKDTFLWIEDVESPRLRLGGGALGVLGPAIVTSALGVVEVVEGAARVELSGGRLSVEAYEAGVTLVGSGGLRELSAGERASVSLAEPAPAG